MLQDRGNRTYREIMSQGEAWQSTLRHFDTKADAVLHLLQRTYSEVIFTGCGSTYYLSLSAAATWQRLTGIRARGVPASELWLFPNIVLSQQKTLLVPVSRSGETTETLKALDVFKKHAGADDILAISVYEDCELAKNVPLALITEGAEEESIAQTRSFTSMLLLTQAFANLASGDEDAMTSLRKVPGHFRRLIEMYEPLCKTLAADQNLNRFTFLGSGTYYGLACEAMLKMKEMSLSASEAFHFLEFRHGPKSVAAPGTLVIGLVSDTACEEEIKVLKEMQELGAVVMAIVDRDNHLPVNHVVELHTGISEVQRAALMLPVLQLLAFHRAYEKGLDPDKPTNLDAVVRLSEYE